MSHNKQINKPTHGVTRRLPSKLTIKLTSNYLNRKGMIWYAEFVIAIFIFLFAMGIYFEYRNNVINEDTNRINEILTDAKIFSNALMSGGHPLNWTPTTVKRIGLTDNNYRINETKLNYFEGMDEDNVTSLFNIREDYYMHLENRDGKIVKVNGADGIGNPPENETGIVTITRVIIYKHNLTKMIIDIWE